MKAPRTVSRRRTSEVITKPTPKRTTAPSSSSACEGPWPDHASSRRASSAAATPMLAPQTALVAVKKRRSGQMPSGLLPFDEDPLGEAAVAHGQEREERDDRRACAEQHGDHQCG